MSQIKQETSTILGPVGHTLHAVRWSPPCDPKGLVYLCHGYDEHMDYYDEIGQSLAEKGFLAFGHDHPGNGRSSGPHLMSHCLERDFGDNVIFDCEEKLKEFGEKLPLYIIGHSMGGLITCRVLTKRQDLFKAAVLMGAALEFPPENTTPLKMAGIKLLNFVWSGCPMGSLDVNAVTRDESRLETIRKDPLRGRAPFKAGFAHAFMEEIKSVGSKLSEITLPVLIQHGEKDALIPPSASELIFNSISSTDKSKHIYPEAYHNMYHDISPIRDEAMQEAIQWILDHHSSEVKE